MVFIDYDILFVERFGLVELIGDISMIVLLRVYLSITLKTLVVKADANLSLG